MSQKRKKKPKGGASGSSTIARSQAKKAKKRNKTRDRILAFAIAIVFWIIALLGWNSYSESQFEKRQEGARAYQTRSFLQKIDIALSTYAENSGGGIPQSPDPGTGGIVLFKKLAIQNENDDLHYLPVWAGQLSKLKSANGEETTLVDSWGNPIQYRAPGERGAKYDLWSTGGDPANEKNRWISVPPTQ